MKNNRNDTIFIGFCSRSGTNHLKLGGDFYLKISNLKSFLSLLILLSTLTISNPYGETKILVSLPSLKGWEMDPLLSVPLKSAEGEEGWWTEGVYKKPANPTVKVVLIEGANVAWNSLEHIEPDPNNSGLFDSEATYEFVQVKDKKGVMESHPLLGNVLALPITPQVTITIETKGSKNYLLEFSQLLLEEISKEDN